MKEIKDKSNVRMTINCTAIAIMMLLFINDTKTQSCVGEDGVLTWEVWQNVVDNSDSSSIFTLEDFPHYPDHSQTIGSTQASFDYDDNYVSRIHGFLYVDVTQTVHFNVTSDDRGYLYLSTDEDPANKRLVAHSRGYSGDTQHYRYPEQTSTSIQLVANQNYYFEILHKEYGGGDDINVYWNDDFPADSTWLIIPNQSVRKYDCNLGCEQRGVACDDGSATTTDDMWDGYCNCIGQPDQSGLFTGGEINQIGDRSKVYARYFDNISGNQVDDLEGSPSYPMLPDRVEMLGNLFGPIAIQQYDDYGSLIQGYLVVPQSGLYSFNVTGDDQAIFYLSEDHTTTGMQDSIHTRYGASFTDFDKYPEQTLDNRQMDAGKYYYFELKLKAGNVYRDFFSVQWKTPFYGTDKWKRIPKFYLYEYDGIMCIPMGTPCNDNNPYTNNDQIDANCDCAGTPCAGQDCDDPEAQFVANESCGPTAFLKADESIVWTSCQTRPNPNTNRDSGHWVMYDFAVDHSFENIHIWNYNVSGLTGRGVKSVNIDYSFDGITWMSYGGAVEWPQATGDDQYIGFSGPDLGKMEARYILLTALSNWDNSSCTGLSKITFEATVCAPAGTACDDRNPLTINDAMDDFCTCTGIDINMIDCAMDTLSLAMVEIAENDYSAKMQIDAQGIISNTYNISFTAGDQIILMPGFEVQTDAQFTANIEECIESSVLGEIERADELKRGLRKSKSNELVISDGGPNLNTIKEIFYKLNKGANVQLRLLSIEGKVLYRIVDHYYDYPGVYKKLLPVSNLTDPIYLIELTVDGEKMIEKLLVNPL